MLFIFSILGSENLLEEISAGIKYQESLIKDWRATCYITVKMDTGEVKKEQEIWAQKGAKLYREKRKGNEEVLYIISFDGELLRTVGDNKKALINVPTDNELEKTFLDVTSPLSLFRIIRLENKPISSFLLEQEKNKNVELVRKIEINEEECYLIKLKEQKNGGIFRYSFYISPYYGFNPLKILIEIENEYGDAKSAIENTYLKQGNVWFLKKSITKNTLDFEKYKRDYKGDTTYEVELEGLEINKGIPDTFFQIEFPKGTRVYDERTGVSYTVE